MKQIDQTYTINAPINKVWQALTDASLIAQWTGGPAEFDASEGGKFSLWGGDIHGTNTKIVENELLEEDWYGGDSPDNCYKVSFSLSPEGNSTVVRLIHAGIPDKEKHDFAEGWKEYYFDSIRDLIEKQ